MKKLSLDLDELTVESFETIGAEDERGTVVAHGSTGAEILCHCSGLDTCGEDCGSGSSATCGEGGPNTYDVGCYTYEICPTVNRPQC